jgi:hypothetical protein
MIEALDQAQLNLKYDQSDFAGVHEFDVKIILFKDVH